MSGSNSRINIAITSSDTVAKQVAEITKQLDRLKTPAERAGEAVGKFADPGKISSLATGMADVSRASFTAFMNITRMVTPLGALTGAASLAGLARMTQQWADAGVQLGTSATRARIGVDQMAKWQGAAYLAGSSSEALTSGVTALNDSLTKAANGTSPAAIMAFGALGMSFRNADGSVKSVTEAFPELIARLHAVQNPTIRAERAADLLQGAASGLEPVINGGADAFRRFTDEATRANAMTARQVDVARDFQRAQRDTTLAVGGLANSIEEKVSPALADLLRATTRWIEGTDKAGNSNRDLVANDVAGWANAQVTSLTAVAGVIDTAVTNTIGWKNATDALEVLMAGRLLVTLGKITGAVTVLKGAKNVLELLGAAGGFGLGGTAAVAGGGLAAGAVAGKMNMPMVDDFGNVTGNWGGAQGEQAYNREANAILLESMRRLMLGMVGGLSTHPRNGTGPSGAPSASGGGIWDWLHRHLGIGAQAAERSIGPMPRIPGLGSPASLPPPGAAVPGDGASPSPSGFMPRGVRNNNPGNLRSWAGAGQSDGYAVFRNAQEGLAAMRQNLEAYASKHGIDTLRGIVMRWAPPSDGNNTEAYIRSVAKSAGIPDADAHLNMNDPAIKAALMRAMIRVEQGYNAYSDQMINQAAGMGAGGPAASVPGGAQPAGPAWGMPPPVAPSGPPASVQGGSGRAPAGASDATVNGQASLLVRLAGFPHGTSAVAKTDGDLFKEGGPVRIEQIGVGRPATA